MWYIILVTFYIHLYVCGAITDYEIVRWKISSAQGGAKEFDISNPGIVPPLKPFKIILENYNASEFNVGCIDRFTKIKFETNSEQLKESGKEGIVIYIENANYAMSTYWKCTVYKNSTPHYITFIIHIKGKETVKMSVGRLELLYTYTSEVEYDGIGKYLYTDGEMVDFVCKSYYFDSDDFLRLTYYNAIGTAMFATNKIHSKYPINFRKLMNEANDNDYIDCSYITSYNIEYKYKIVFKLKSHTTSQNPLKITVDHLKLIPANSSDTENYQYRFVDGQVFSVTCEIDPKLQGILKLGFERKRYDKNIMEATDKNMRWKVTKWFKATRDLNYTNLWCIAEDMAPQHKANILLILEHADPYIVGLSRQDVIQEYSIDSATWYIDYQYSVNQTLNLTCVAAPRSRPKFQWIMRDDREHPLTSIDGDTNKNYVLTFKEEHNRQSLICDITEGRAVINLYLKSDSPLEEYADVALIVGASVTVSGIALMGVCIIMCKRMRKKKGVRQESRENLTRDSPIPAFPSQWAQTSNDYEEEAMTTNSLYVASSAPVYARPVKKTQRNTEPLYHIIDPVYNVPAIEGNHGTGTNEYTNPVPKNINNTNKNLNKDGQHLQNVKEHTYDYIPVTNNSTNEYAEPLYCEIPLGQ